MPGTKYANVNIANNSRKEISAAAPNKYKSLGSFTKISDIDDKRCSVVH